MNTVEIADKKNELKKQAVEICERCKNEIRDFTDAEKENIESIKKQIDELNEEQRKIEESLKDNSDLENNKKTQFKKTMDKEFRLLKTINDVANNRNLNETANAVISLGAEEMRKSGLSYGGQIQLPVEERAVISVTTEGEDTVATELTSILEPLRAKNVLIQAGAKYMTGLVGDVQIPILGATNVTWEGETASASDGAGGFTSVKLSPKRLTCYVDVSKQFLIQDSIDAENMLKADIVNAINSKLEATILGTANGSATQPKGIFYINGPVTESRGDFGSYLDLESSVANANVMGECVYIMDNKSKSKARSTEKSETGIGFIMQDGTIDGTKVLATSHVQNGCVAYGDFSNLVIGQWGSIDLTVDPFTKAADGQVRLVVNAYFDAKLVREDAVATMRVSVS